MAAQMLCAIKSRSSWQRTWPDQALERTATRCVFIFQMIKAILVKATLALGDGRSSWSR
jgi:hypothetical protein